jgi:HAD superfamily phosphatase (TIGR01668 family)
MYRLITPDAQLDSVGQIDTAKLKEKGIEGIIFDLDNTLMPWDSKELPSEISFLIEKILSEGFKILILSNARERRVADIFKPLSIPYIAHAWKPKKSGFQKALELMDLSPQKTAIIGDQLFTDILGGNLTGLYTIWVKPISQREFITTKFNRQLEKIAVRILKTKGLLK